ncbi:MULTISPECIES: tyrosine-type recombinase/integrase [Pseudobacillus]|uniref:tyrosine-type recombinase/integrase n=1 Tax=Pseudobacillus TaxID=108525 RepID=UPI00387A387B
MGSKRDLRKRTESLPAVLNEFLLTISQEGKKDSTVEMYKNDLHLILKWLRQEGRIPQVIEKVADLSTSDLVDFLWTTRGEFRYAPATLKRMSYTIRHLLRYDGRSSPELEKAIQCFRREISTDLSENDVMSLKEFSHLVDVLRSEKGLSDYEALLHPLTKDRNIAIVTLMYKYGLSLQETALLTMQDISFSANTLQINGDHKRMIHLNNEDKKLIYLYYKGIPHMVRPRLYSSNPMFISLDVNRKTFFWIYETNSPKQLSTRAIQLMIQKEMRRAGFPQEMSAQTLRNSFIVNVLLEGWTRKELMDYLGIQNATLDRYIRFAKHKTIKKAMD